MHNSPMRLKLLAVIPFQARSYMLVMPATHSILIRNGPAQ